MKAVIDTFIDLGSIGEKPCVIHGDVTHYGGTPYVEFAVDCMGINIEPMLPDDLRGDFRTMLVEQAEANTLNLRDAA